MYAYWIGTPVMQQKARNPKWGDMTWQHRAWYSFLWICGDQIVEQHLHNIDVCNWVMGGHPVECVASGGAAWRPRDEIYGCIYDHVSAGQGGTIALRPPAFGGNRTRGQVPRGESQFRRVARLVIPERSTKTS